MICTIKHVDEILKLLTVLTGDEYYEQSITDFYADKGRRGNLTMCEVIEKAMAKGRAEGETNGMIKTLCSLVKKGILTISVAAKEAGMSEKEFKKQACL